MFVHGMDGAGVERVKTEPVPFATNLLPRPTQPGDPICDLLHFIRVARECFSDPFTGS